MNNKEQPLVDQVQREKAEEAIDDSICLEAGAGTGKTTLLVNRYLSVLKKGRAKCTEMVAITFTEKAAAEMKTRLRREISTLAQSDADGNFEMGGALVDLERAPISTIHSFAASLLRDFPVEAGIDPGFSMLTDPDDSLFLEECWYDFLSETSHPHDYFLKRFLGVGGGVDKLKELAFTFYYSRSQRYVTGILEKDDMKKGYPKGAVPKRDSGKQRKNLIDIKPFYEALKKYSIILSQSIREYCTTREDKGYKEIDRFLKQFVKADKLEGEVLENFLLQIDLPKPKGAKSNWNPPEKCSEQKNIVKEMAKLQKEYRQFLMDRIVEGLTLWFEEFLEFVEKQKSAEGILEFDDLLIEARKLLGNSEVLELLKERYRYILVDEFQDTDSLQAEIVFLLGGMGKDGELGKRSGHSSLFIVGDPKQSIYRFRKADIEVYETVKEHFFDEDLNLKITQNFRSGSGILDWINASFSALIKKPEDGRYQPAYEAIHAHRRDRDTSVALLDLEYGDNEKKAAELRALEGKGVARLIKWLIGEGRLVRDVDTKQFRPVRYSDIALIYRGSTGLENYEDPLRSEEIPYIVEGGGLYFARQEIRDFSSAVWAIEDPWDSVALVSTLRSSLFGFSDEEIYLFKENGGKLDYLSGKLSEGSGFEDLGKAFGLLADLHEKRNQRGVAETVKELVRRTNFKEVSLFRTHGDQRVANINKALQKARDFDKSLRSFRYFAGWLRDQGLSGTKEGESSLVEEDENVVRLTTVHKSKGLQFPVVIMINLLQEIRYLNHILIDGGRKIDFKLNENWQTSEFAARFELDKLKENAENVRLLYVAATRSGDLLVIPKVPKKKSYFQLLENSLPLDPDKESSGLASIENQGSIPASTGKSRSGDNEADDLSTKVPLRGDLLEENESREAKDFVSRLRVSQFPPLNDVAKPFTRIPEIDNSSRREGEKRKEHWLGERRELIKKAVSAPLVISPSSVKGGLSVSRSDYHESDLKREGGKGSSGRAAEFGLAFHRLMELADFKASNDLGKLAEAISIDYGLAGMENELISLAAKALSSDLIKRVSKSERVFREVPFSVPVRGQSPGADSREIEYINGRIDLLFSSAGGWTVVDYKTDDVKNVEERFQLYRGQGAIYAFALMGLGIELAGGVVFYFVRPDKEITLKISDIRKDDLKGFSFDSDIFTK